MSLDVSAVLPLLGVAIGWLLSEAGFLLRDRRKRKKTIGRTILKLLEIRDVIREEQARLDLAKEYEKKGRLSEYREFLREIKPDRSRDVVSDIKSVLMDIAGVDPFLAFNLHHRLTAIGSVLKQAGTYTGEGEEEQIKELLSKGLMMAEGMMFQTSIAELKVYIIRLARKKGTLSLFRAWWHFRNEKAFAGDTAAGFADMTLKIDAVRQRMASK